LAHRGRFITLEGGEGAGKSTLAAALKARLTSRNIDVLLTREPGGTPAAELLRNTLLSPPAGITWPPLSEALMFYAARVDHLEQLIRPHLADGGWVICDRFSDSTRAYQTAERPEMAATIETLEALCVGADGPDLTLILDLPLEIAQTRMAQRGRPQDAMESRGSVFHQKVRDAFLDIARREADRCIVLDASASADELAHAAMRAIDSRLGAV
jgi:dTMP kinase